MSVMAQGLSKKISQAYEQSTLPDYTHTLDGTWYVESRIFNDQLIDLKDYQHPFDQRGILKFDMRERFKETLDPITNEVMDTKSYRTVQVALSYWPGPGFNKDVRVTMGDSKLTFRHKGGTFTMSNSCGFLAANNKLICRKNYSDDTYYEVYSRNR